MSDIDSTVSEVIQAVAPVSQYAQVTVEASVHLRTDSGPSTEGAAGYSARSGVGVLLLQDTRWRYFSAAARDLDLLSRWIIHIGGQGVSLEPPALPAVPFGGESPDSACGSSTARVVEEVLVSRFAAGDSDGRLQSELRTRHRRRAFVALRRDGETHEARARAHRSRGTGEWIGFVAIPDMQKHAEQQARLMLASRSMGSHSTAVVFTRATGAAFLHELIGHGIEADNLNAGGPYAVQLRRDTQWLHPDLRLVDDPREALGYGYAMTDDEGNAAETLTLVSHGRVVGALQSQRHVLNDGRPRSFQGRRDSFGSPALPRTSTTLVCPGRDEHATLFEPGASGLLVVRSMGGGHVNIQTGAFSFTVALGTYVTRSGFETHVRDVRLRGNAVDALRRLDAIGDDLEHDSAICGKGGQELPIGLSSPSLRFEDLTWTS